MDKSKTIFECEKCGAQFPKWSGRCLGCGAWSTLKETFVASTASNSHSPTLPSADLKHLQTFADIKDEKLFRLKTNILEFDRVLGGGIVPGSLILLGGDPGIGKSTLSLQIMHTLKDSPSLLYVSGEESASQVKLRANRLNYAGENLKFLNETDSHQITAIIENQKPNLAIIDSIQTIYNPDLPSEPGNVAQIKAVTVELMQTAKKHNIPIILTGHVTKDGNVAGPRTLEHLVDVVLYLEGDNEHGYRLLRSVKNRFGTTNELGVFNMTGTGLAEVENPAEIFLSRHEQQTPGAVFSAFLKGHRAFLVEIQALVTPTVFGYPVRKTSGYDNNRLQLLTAVIGKRMGINLQNQDIHLNVVGGFEIDEHAIDLAVVAAIVSAKNNITIPSDTIVLGEVGLGGEVRTISQIERRLQEAEKLHFKNAIIPTTKNLPATKIQSRQIKNINELKV